MGAPFSPPRGGQETEVDFPLRPLPAPIVLFQKLPTLEECFPTSGDDEVVRFSFLEEANNALRRQRQSDSIPLNGAFNVVAHG
jgi:hypothetical protein